MRLHELLDGFKVIVRAGSDDGKLVLLRAHVQFVASKLVQ